VWTVTAITYVASHCISSIANSNMIGSGCVSVLVVEEYVIEK
jgi:hypothetical protein